MDTFLTVVVEFPQTLEDVTETLELEVLVDMHVGQSQEGFVICQKMSEQFPNVRL